MDEEIVVRMHNRVSFNLKKKKKKKGDPAVCNNVDGPGGHYEVK